MLYVQELSTALTQKSLNPPDPQLSSKHVVGATHYHIVACVHAKCWTYYPNKISWQYHVHEWPALVALIQHVGKVVQDGACRQGPNQCIWMLEPALKEDFKVGPGFPGPQASRHMTVFKDTNCTWDPSCSHKREFPLGECGRRTSTISTSRI